MVKGHQFNPHACGSSGGLNDEFHNTCINFSAALNFVKVIGHFGDLQCIIAQQSTSLNIQSKDKTNAI